MLIRLIRSILFYILDENNLNRIQQNGPDLQFKPYKRSWVIRNPRRLPLNSHPLGREIRFPKLPDKVHSRVTHHLQTIILYSNTINKTHPGSNQMQVSLILILRNSMSQNWCIVNFKCKTYLRMWIKCLEILQS